MSNTPKIDDGGPAFPVCDLSKTQCPGMSLRAYLAGQALAGQLASFTNADTVRAQIGFNGDPFSMAARSAVKYADALIAELRKEIK